MNLQPTLEGQLTTLKPLKDSDFEFLYAAASNPEVWEQHPCPDRFKRSVFEEFFATAMKSQGAFAIYDRATGAIIGSSRYYDLNLESRDLVIGYTFFAKEFWGKGHNREVKKLMLDYAFQFVDTVYFHVGEKNFRSQKAMKGIGAEFVKHVVFEDSAGRQPHFIYKKQRVNIR